MAETDGAASPPPTVLTRPPADPRKWPAWARAVPGGHLLVLRAFLGVTFCYAGLQKLATRGFFQAGNPASIQAQLKASALVTPVGHLLEPAVHAAVAVGLLISFGELAVGVGTLLGLYARMAASGGMVLALLFFLTVSYNSSPYYYGPDIVFLFAWTPLALNGAGALSLDAYFATRRDLARAEAGAAAGGDGALDRRTAVAKVATASLVGGIVLFLGGMATAVGRVLGRRTSALTGPTFPAAPAPAAPATTAAGSGPSASGGVSTTTSPGSGGGRPRGRLLGPASAVAVGGAVGFTDPFQGIPAYVVQPRTGEFLGFSAVCTHAGCTVAFVQSAEQFQCPCHGSIYSAVTGDVIQGPAPRPLPAIGIELHGSDLYVTD